MKKYWWVVSIVVTGFVGGEGPDDKTYPVKKKTIFKLFGPKDETTYKKLVSKISSVIKDKNKEIDFVWCLASNGIEQSHLSAGLYMYLMKKFSQ